MSMLAFIVLLTVLWMLTDILKHVAEQNKKNKK